MLSSPSRLAANRANAARSTGPRTPEGKAASSPGTRLRVSLSHGAYATDDILLSGFHAAIQSFTPESPAQDKNEAIPGFSVTDSESAPPPAAPDEPCHDIAGSRPTGDGPALLASFTSHYNPAGPAETLLVRRIVAASLRIDLLERSLDALLELGERRAVVDHLSDRFARDLPTMQVRDQPNWSAMLRRYDGNPGVPPSWGPDPTDDPALDPDPALCTLAYTLSSPRAALLMRHEAAAERRLHVAMRELHRLQADRRTQQKQRNEPIPDHAEATRNKANTAYASASWKEAIRDAEAVLHDTTFDVFTAPPPTPDGNEATVPHVESHLRAASDVLHHAAATDTSSATVKNEPITPPTSEPDPRLGTPRIGRNEPIPAASTLSRRPATSSTGRQPWTLNRRSAAPDPLEHLIRRAEQISGAAY